MSLFFFAANIKKLNAGQQSVDETLEKVHTHTHTHTHTHAEPRSSPSSPLKHNSYTRAHAHTHTHTHTLLHSLSQVREIFGEHRPFLFAQLQKLIRQVFLFRACVRTCVPAGVAGVFARAFLFLCLCLCLYLCLFSPIVFHVCPMSMNM